MRPRILFLSLMVGTQAGCYSYVPTRLESVEPGTSVRLRISPEEVTRLQEMRRSDDRVLDGVLLTRGSDEVLVETSVGSIDPTRGTRALNQRVGVSLSGIRDVELRRLDRFRTGALLGGGGVALGLIVAAQLQEGRNDPDGIPDGPLEGRRFLLPIGLRISVP